MKSAAICIVLALVSLCLSGCLKSVGKEPEQHHEAHHQIVVTSPVMKDVVTTQDYVCQIHSRCHIELCALVGGYLEEIYVNEGQAVQEGELMFKILPVVYQAKLDSDAAEAQLAQIEFNNTEKLFRQRIVSDQEVALAKAKLAKAQAQVKLAQAELNFTAIRAPFSGIIDRLHKQQGSLLEEGEMLTTMSDNDVMWVYFNVPEVRYLEYQAGLSENADDLQIELVLANGEKFPQTGKIAAIEADFNNETGNVAFRADFPNPDSLLRHGQTGSVLIHRTLKNVMVIPQRATFEILDKRYVFVVGEDGVVHQHEIHVRDEMEDIFILGSGLDANTKIILDGVRQVRDGERVEPEFRDPEEVLADLKYHAE